MCSGSCVCAACAVAVREVLPGGPCDGLVTLYGLWGLHLWVFLSVRCLCWGE